MTDPKSIYSTKNTCLLGKLSWDGDGDDQTTEKAHAKHQGATLESVSPLNERTNCVDGVPFRWSIYYVVYCMVYLWPHSIHHGITGGYQTQHLQLLHQVNHAVTVVFQPPAIVGEQCHDVMTVTGRKRARTTRGQLIIWVCLFSYSAWWAVSSRAVAKAPFPLEMWICNLLQINLPR